ncbi:molybdopterin-dependent oxidoreductase [Halorhabdus sp. CUG00001]|uniref:molybdopterin-dependent oxidoreductase n=1 Tax=Halorhabdus sp. CUG00001 TaxID=2600297 RepID=UPI00131D0806|nr:molybdopterin-dependent oxidoreductase [Halorhabdus sp. CUG00001]
MARTRTTALFWGGGALAWVLGMVAARPLVGGDPTLVVAQTLIEAAPGSIATWAIETFGKYAQWLLVVGVSFGIVGAGATIGVALDRGGLGFRRRLQLSYAIALGVFAVTASGFYVADGGISSRWLLATILAIVPPGAVWWAQVGPRAAVGRRRAMRRMSGAAGTVLAGGALARVLGESPSVGGVQPGADLDPVDEKTGTGRTTPAPTGTPGGEALESRSKTNGVVVSEAASDATFGFDFEGMPDRVGTIEDHYVVDKNISAPTVTTDQWELTIDGAVEEPRALSYEELTEHPAARELTLTMVCISNTVGGDLISTTDWTGIPMQTLLEETGVDEDAIDIVTHAADGYSEALPWSVVSEREDILLAFGMDGKTLPKRHGFPARLLIPGRYGMKSTKWVTGLEVSASDHEAYWEKRGWDERAVINTLSYVRAIQRRGAQIAVGGIAYAGIRGVEGVDVSLDGGETWAEATLESAPSASAWNRWRYEFTQPNPEALDVRVRATDGDGNRQRRGRSNPHPGGSTGWHSVTLSL